MELVRAPPGHPVLFYLPGVEHSWWGRNSRNFASLHRQLHMHASTCSDCCLLTRSLDNRGSSTRRVAVYRRGRNGRWFDTPVAIPARPWIFSQMCCDSEFKSVRLAPADGCCDHHAVESQQRCQWTNCHRGCRILWRMSSSTPRTGLPRSNYASCTDQFCNGFQCSPGRHPVIGGADRTALNVPGAPFQGFSGAFPQREHMKNSSELDRVP